MKPFCIAISTGISPEILDRVRAAAGPDATLARYDGPERFDILPLLVATDGAITSFGGDVRRLRPNIVIDGVDGMDEITGPAPSSTSATSSSPSTPAAAAAP